MGVAPRAASALIWGLTAGFFAAAFALQDVLRGDAVAPDAIRGTAILAVCHFLGGALAGWLLAPLFGRGGAPGTIVALIGAVLVMPLGGLAGGALAALWGVISNTSDTATEMLRVAVGAMTTPLAVAEMPALNLVWVIALVAAHLIGRRARKRGGLRAARRTE